MAAVREGEDPVTPKQHPVAEDFASLRPALLLRDKGRPHQVFTPSSSPFQPWAFAPSFSWPWAQAEPLTGLLLQYVPKWVTCSLGDSGGGDSPGGRPSAAPSAGCPGGRRRCYSGFAPVTGRDGVTPRGSSRGARAPRSFPALGVPTPGSIAAP